MPFKYANMVHGSGVQSAGKGKGQRVIRTDAEELINHETRKSQRGSGADRNSKQRHP